MTTKTLDTLTRPAVASEPFAMTGDLIRLARETLSEARASRFWPAARNANISAVSLTGRTLCELHIRSRLRGLGLWADIRHVELPAVDGRHVDAIPRNVFLQLDSMLRKLERRHPGLYSDVCRQMGLTTASEKSMAKMLRSVAGDMFRPEVTWFKIASFYGLVSGLAVDCVRRGHPEYLYSLTETAGLIIERDVAAWIVQKGGWVSNRPQHNAWLEIAQPQPFVLFN